MLSCNYTITLSGLKTIVQTFTKNLKSLSDVKEKAYPMTSMAILMVGEFLAIKLKFANDYFLLVILLNGFVFGYMSSKLIVATMAKVLFA
jgi:hypothetical protein